MDKGYWIVYALLFLIGVVDTVRLILNGSLKRDLRNMKNDATGSEIRNYGGRLLMILFFFKKTYDLFTN